MVTHTYYVVRFLKDGDPRPKYLGSDTQVGLFQTCHEFGVKLNDGLIITTAEDIKGSYLCSIDTCCLCNDCFGNLCFCGKPVIHTSPLFR